MWRLFLGGEEGRPTFLMHDPRTCVCVRTPLSFSDCQKGSDTYNQTRQDTTSITMPRQDLRVPDTQAQKEGSYASNLLGP